eukprot:3251483-Rhodomonas_salina.3
MAEPMQLDEQVQVLRLSWSKSRCRVLLLFTKQRAPNPTSATPAQPLSTTQHNVSAMLSDAVDKDLHSRTIAALGEEMVRAIASSNVSLPLVLGLRPYPPSGLYSLLVTSIADCAYRDHEEH